MYGMNVATRTQKMLMTFAKWWRHYFPFEIAFYFFYSKYKNIFKIYKKILESFVFILNILFFMNVFENQNERIPAENSNACENKN